VSPIDPPTGSRNGYGKPRAFSMMSGTVTVRRPRVRDLTERFESKVLSLFKRRTQEVGTLLPELYLHGLSTGDFDLALRGLLGEGAPLSELDSAYENAAWYEGVALGGSLMAKHNNDLDVVELFAVTSSKRLADGFTASYLSAYWQMLTVIGLFRVFAVSALGETFCHILQSVHTCFYFA
jgi:hypothetical protein